MMLRKLLLLTFIFLVIGAYAQKKKLKVFQLNIWQEGTVVPNGFEALVDEIAYRDADLVALSEVRNYDNTKFHERIVSALAKRGKVYYSFFSDDSGILSKYPILEHAQIGSPQEFIGTIYKAVVSCNGAEIAFYTGHLEYTKGANYLPRGYHADTWEKLEKPIVDVDSILANSLSSSRDEAISLFLADATLEEKKNRLVIFCGDFNEASYLDWTSRTSNLFDHKGLVIPWQNTSILAKQGYVDAFRKVYPDEVRFPGFTFPAYNKDVEIKKLIWGADADERDRIDFVFYKENTRLKATKAYIVGPKESILRGKMAVEQDESQFLLPRGIWPTDHKGVLVDFVLRK
ncbi:endonuclease/exonuclease/phosphatase family protein [Sphingobacterium sp. SRCM116780]|uniref:endonuclease/exonuclease/phosphatase family protein n=1 Tax=Sphingobacterium sp. SRCM116780 TaxID=2907623 RepID=UPI001F364440|nr:endonuclease/exonuclease/phosphatase family protein [Sphingobacterium sp. SRCM116780]UIR55556.1 endonuclease/exonuclease/phosphatase family protein [Sphingobacterium sp. SRCM116780]